MQKTESVKAFCRAITGLGYRHQPYQVFHDFCELAALSLRQPFERSPELEAKYHELIQPYGDQGRELFGELLKITVEALTEQPRDFLGECFHSLELHNKYKGQYFTPYVLSEMMAQMAIAGTADQHIRAKGYLSANEPTCGSGGMVVAMAETLKALGHNPTNTLWVVAQDIDRKCCCMAYIQMSLLAIPGAVIWGNTLLVECREQWLTAGYYLGPWADRFRWEKVFAATRKLALEPEPEPVEVEAVTPSVPATGPAEQLEFGF